MKKTFRIRMTILTIIFISVVLFITYKVVMNHNRKYEIAEVKQYNYFLLKENDLFGVINKNGDFVINAEYDDIKIPNPEKAVFVCYKNNQSRVLNDKKEEILKQYEEVETIRLKNISGDLVYEKSVLKYLENGKYGLITFDGKKITKAIYDEIDSLEYKEGELIVKQNDKYGIINIKGGKIVATKYDNVSLDEYYTESAQYKNAGYIVSNRTEEGYRYGYIDYKGKIIEGVEYNELSRVQIAKNNDIYILCAKNGQYGINKNGKDLIPNEYQSIVYDEANDLFVIEKSKKYGIANLEGKIIVPVEYTQIDVTGIYLYAHDEQGIIVYSNKGEQVNVDTNIALLNTPNEKYRIRINNQDRTKYGLIGKDGKQIIQEKYTYMEYLYDNYFIVSDENSKLGIINDKDEQKVEIKYDSVQKVQDTNVIQTTIAEDNITEFYSKNLEKICEMTDAIIEVQKDYIKIYNQEEIQYFDRDGNKLSNMQVYPNNKLFTKENNGKWGFVDKNGNMIVDYRYDKATEFNEYGYAAVQLNGKWGSIDEQGKEVQKPIYEFNNEIVPSFIGKYYKLIFGFGEFYFTD